MQQNMDLRVFYKKQYVNNMKIQVKWFISHP